MALNSCHFKVALENVFCQTAPTYFLITSTVVLQAPIKNISRTRDVLESTELVEFTQRLSELQGCRASY